MKDGLQLWKIAANTMNEQKPTNDEEWSSAWGLGVGLKTHLHKN
jgi:hypothetical protein